MLANDAAVAVVNVAAVAVVNDAVIANAAAIAVVSVVAAVNDAVEVINVAADEVVKLNVTAFVLIYCSCSNQCCCSCTDDWPIIYQSWFQMS